MYQKRPYTKTTLKVNKSYEGERIEEKIQRIVNNKEPISDGAPIIYTERKDGVNPAHDIRTDRWELAADAMDKVSKSNRAKRENKPGTIGEQAVEGMKKEQDGGAKPTDTTT